MAEPASEYHHGDQDIREQQRTFRDAMVATKWAIVALAALIAFLTLWFCTAAGFFSALITAVVIVVVGVVALRERRSTH
jgi:archaellum biogenesis protein FlaJ (TadC family)